MRAGILVIIMLAKQSLAVIYSLNESQYELMPPLFALDEYGGCLREVGGVYCLVDVDLRGEGDLMKMIRGYSAHKIKHFNHTQIHRGVCVKRTCKDYIRKLNLNIEGDLRVTLGACLNESLTRSYGIEGTIARVDHCVKEGDSVNLDLSDILMAVVYLVIILLNVVGSFYDILFYDDNEKKGNPYLLAFSVKRNWRRLVGPSGGGDDPRLARLKLFHGMRTMTMICVLFSHTVLIMAFSYVDNPLYIEKSYEDPLKQILFNGSLVTHTFFVMSSFLLAYNFQIHAEKRRMGWGQLPKGVLLRWIRLTPAYALVLASICTWMRYAGSGPLWGLVVGSEVEACRRYWWAHLLYVNNYVYDDAMCAPQTWYLAADTQMFCIGLLLCVVVQTARARKVALGILFLVSLVITALHTYLQDLDAVVIQTPETYRSLYAHSDTFRLLYIRGHTNLSTYTLGLAGGFLAHHWQKEEKDFTKYRNYRWVIWLLVPLAIGVILSGGLFYINGAPAPTPLRVLYATLYKPIFQILVVTFIIGCIFKIETVYRGIVEWRGFTWTGRVSYCAFLLHTLIQRGLMGTQLTNVHMTDYFVFVTLSATIFLSYLCGAILWLLVEAPATALTKAAQAKPRDGIKL